ncbi:histone-lysine N-methyltransferase SMYD3-like [Paramacrobiotus metropolitanus]|uniref:histone-lysine N-methyltransferase SMYD3-like n=1 Tax=Paramacrobiotus metropolitanus TaxID=2943436 RepID=UPI002445F715|nr:histone-lysine N-methyltransferase SMYD3-like [Paramacrobiotus metropolitanus]
MAGPPNDQNDPPHLVAAGEVVVTSEPWVWSFPYNTHKVLCAQCFTETAGLRVCSSCKLYRYCNKECQLTNWKKEHKHECAMLKNIHKKLQPFQAAGAFAHDCGRHQCCLYGCCAGEILVAKIINKITKGLVEKVSGFPGNVTAQQVLDVLPLQPIFPSVTDVFEHFNRMFCAVIWPDTVSERTPHFEEMVQKLTYNILPVFNQRNKVTVQMIAIFPRALQRLMTPVCLDSTVTMDLQGRTMMVRAVQDIYYTGLQDLRQNEEILTSYFSTLMERRKEFERIYGYSCGCSKCTTEYDADINPLKCSTVGCPARIPSDTRALQPCPQCKADNVPQLQKWKAIVTACGDMENNFDPHDDLNEAVKAMERVKRMDTVVHPDAHLRFVCGMDAADFVQAMGGYEDAWKLVVGMIDCVRVIYPDYHLGRARYMVKSAAIPYLWKRAVDEKEQQRLAPVFQEALPKALGWLWEAERIYQKLNGEDSVWAQAVVDFIRIHAPEEVGATENAVPSARKANWDWGMGKQLFFGNDDDL